MKRKQQAAGTNSAYCDFRRTSGPVPSPQAQPDVYQWNHMATFGEAELFKNLDGLFELRGGTKEDREQAEEWLRKFYPDVAEELFG